MSGGYATKMGSLLMRGSSSVELAGAGADCVGAVWATAREAQSKEAVRTKRFKVNLRLEV